MSQASEQWYDMLLQLFQPLNSQQASRPNTPVNILVSAMILKEQRGLSYDELMGSVMLDLRFKVDLWLNEIDQKPFSRATLFNFLEEDFGL